MLLILLSLLYPVSVLVISFGSCAQATIIHNHHAPYTIPKPSIQALKGGGFRVSIPHSDGIQLFAFHGNINNPIHDVEAGQIARDVVAPIGDRWLFQDCTFLLKPQDRIYYWLYVQKDDLGYRYHDGEYEVKEISEEECHTGVTPIAETTSESECTCDSVIMNLTKSIIELRDERNALRDRNEILEQLLEKIPQVPTSLVLTAHTPQEWGPLQAVREIIKQKLGLQNIWIESAIRINNETINFNVSSLQDEITVLQAAKEKLKHSRIKITV